MEIYFKPWKQVIEVWYKEIELYKYLLVLDQNTELLFSNVLQKSRNIKHLIIKNVIILKSYKTYSNKILCFKLISLVSKVQRVKPFIEGVIQSKLQVFFTQSCSKLTCKRNKTAIMIMKFFIFVWYAYK